LIELAEVEVSWLAVGINGVEPSDSTVLGLVRFCTWLKIVQVMYEVFF